MGYCTFAQILRDDEHDAPTEPVLERVAKYAKEQGWSLDVVEDVRKALEPESDVDGGMFNKLWCEDIEGMVLYISREFPGVSFSIRGFGEEFHDIWIRKIRNGKVLFSEGPFEVE